jgi:beta-aspartyl-peptidase (threonine type)
MYRVAVVAFVCLVPAVRADDAADIRKVLDDQVAAWNKGDLVGFMKGYWNSKELTFVSGKDATRGWQETLDRYKKRYQADGKEMGKLTFSDLEVRVLSPGVALVTGKWELTLSKETVGGRYTLIMKKLDDGWRIVHDHTSG